MVAVLATVEAIALFLAASAVAVARAAVSSWQLTAAQSGLFTLAVLAAFVYADLYEPTVAGSIRAFAARLLPALLLAALLVTLVAVAVPAAALDLDAIGPSLVAMMWFVLPLRALWCGLLRADSLTHRVLVLGGGPLATAVADELRRRRDRRYTVDVVADADLNAVLASARRPDLVVVALPASARERVMSGLLAVRAHGIPVEDAIDAYERLTGKIAIESLAPSRLVFGRGFRRGPIPRVTRRLISFAVAAIGLVVLAPLFALIALAIRLDSPGAVLFLQKRVGARGRPFTLLKFRTMFPADTVTSEWAADNEDRITRVGRWLRRFRLDELPQLVNVLRGEMDLVGPRPHPVANEELFLRAIPYYSLRSSVPPGVTGWAQIRYGYANNLEEETEKMRYDLYYIKHQSLWLDLRILAATLKFVLLGRTLRIARPRPAAVPLSVRAEQDAA